ncbi:hypothetical protein EJ06DRAFT_550429 [Trichodelitschia bisporula]|uniref:Uncharacterized protein n=1 Tax=Trichodelitschia bisporula TaxID=703511 RepID=A0A6G1HRG9_9PEZI|nr:hypothetical protein EJ06DRAFT_550429 [Trichodelitschia bisporula]
MPPRTKPRPCSPTAVPANPPRAFYNDAVVGLQLRNMIEQMLGAQWLAEYLANPSATLAAGLAYAPLYDLKAAPMGAGGETSAGGAAAPGNTAAMPDASAAADTPAAADAATSDTPAQATN